MFWVHIAKYVVNSKKSVNSEFRKIVQLGLARKCKWDLQESTNGISKKALMGLTRKCKWDLQHSANGICKIVQMGRLMRGEL